MAGASKKKTKKTITLMRTEDNLSDLISDDDLSKLEVEASPEIEEEEDSSSTPTVPPNPNNQGSSDDETPDVCKITPLEAYMSSNLNSKIKSYEDLTTRILNILGFPATSVTDVHIDQIHEAISMAVEMFTRYAGYTQEIMVFDSRLYRPNVGIHLGNLYTVASLEKTHKHWGNQRWIDRGPDHMVKEPDDVYVTRRHIPKSAYFISHDEFEVMMQNCKKVDQDLLCYLKDVSERWPDGIEELSIINDTLYKFLVNRRGYKPEWFKKSKDKVVTEGGEKLTIYAEDEEFGRVRDPLYYSKTYDYDLMDYRKVKSVTNFKEMTSMSPMALFAGEMGMAEQAYFAWEFNNKGFSLVERHALGEWMDMREKILALDRKWNFDPYTQMLTLYPQPRPGTHSAAVIESYVERPLRHIIKDPWVYKYSLAIVKVMIGNIRGKWRDVQLLGGGVISGNRFTQEGNEEMRNLEQMLIEKRGFGSATPPVFIIG